MPEVEGKGNDLEAKKERGNEKGKAMMTGTIVQNCVAVADGRSDAAQKHDAFLSVTVVSGDPHHGR